MNGLTQATIFDSTSPGNIYSATVMLSVNGDQKILMIDSKKDIITLESTIVNGEVETSVVKLDFSHIPENVEIIAIHCINRSKEFDNFAIGITYESILEDKNPEHYLNIYSGLPGSSLEAITKNCETLRLNFAPFQLNHAIYMSESHKKGMWLLSGSDRKIHAYKSDEQLICEQKIQEYFVEYEGAKDSIILSFGVKSYSDYKKRISFYGCDRGYLVLTIVDSEKNQVLHTYTEQFQSPVTIGQLFNIYNKTNSIENIISGVNDNFIPDYDVINEKEPVCFLVASAVECAVVYMNVLENNLTNMITLTNSNRHQAIVTALITDINFDSKNEILLGTYGHYILNYVYENNEWKEQQQYDIRHPVFTICYIDIDGEGVNDVVVMSERGIHLLKHEPQNLIEILNNRLKPLKNI